MSGMLEYKGYFASVEYRDEDDVFHGRLEFIRDSVTFEGGDAKGLEAAFREAVDDYLELFTAGEFPLPDGFPGGRGGA